MVYRLIFLLFFFEFFCEGFNLLLECLKGLTNLFMPPNQINVQVVKLLVAQSLLSLASLSAGALRLHFGCDSDSQEQFRLSLLQL